MSKFLWNFVNIFSTKGLLFLFALLLGNMLPPHDMGVFVSLMLFLTYAQMFFGYQIGSGIVHKLNVQESSDDRAIYYSSGLLLTFLLCLVALVFCYLFEDSIIRVMQLPDDRQFLWLMVPLLLARMMRDYFQRILQADSLFKYLAIINVTSALIQLVLCSYLLVIGFGLDGVVAALYAANVSALVISMILVARRHNFLLVRNTSMNVAGDIVRFCFYVYLASIVVFLDAKIDILLVNFYLSKDELASYSYAIEFALVFVLVGESISQVNYPRFSKAFSLSKFDKACSIYSLSMRVTFLTVSACVMVFGIAANDIISIILPEFYLGMLPALAVLLLGIVPFATLSSVGTIMTSNGQPLYDAIPVTVSLALNVMLSILLIPSIGIVGAAVATSTSFLLRAVLGVVLIEKKTKMNISYARMITAYAVFLGMIVWGMFYIESRVMDAIVAVSYGIFVWHYLLEQRERAWIESTVFPRLRSLGMRKGL